MGDGTLINYADASWSPVRGCSRVSAGCAHCFAVRSVARLQGAGLCDGQRLVWDGEWTGEVKCVRSQLSAPLRWTRPRRILVPTLGDLWHPAVPDHWLMAVWGVMCATPWHTFMVLTKRARAMREWVKESAWEGWPHAELLEIASKAVNWHCPDHRLPWPLPHVWLGVSVENQTAAEERLSVLLDTPAAHRWVSVEPCIGPVDLRPWLVPGGPEWVVVGGENGPGARPCNVEWIRVLIWQCKEAGVPVWCKQLGARAYDLGGDWLCDDGSVPVGAYLGLRDRAGADPSEWPEDLRVRQLPGGAE